MALDEDEGGENGAIKAAVRPAKKASRPAKIGEPERKPLKVKQKTEKRKKDRQKVKARAGGAFERDLGQRAPREGVRAKKGDAIGGLGKKRAGKKK